MMRVLRTSQLQGVRSWTTKYRPAKSLRQQSTISRHRKRISRAGQSRILRDNRGTERSVVDVARSPDEPQPGTELEEFFDLSIDPLSIIGFDGEFKRVNASFVRLLGYTKPELFSRTALDIPHREDVEPAREALAQLAEGSDVLGFEARVVCADGAVRWLEWNTRSMPERGVVYSLGRDTTERRRADAALHEAQRL